jgi:hypothetical protein
MTQTQQKSNKHVDMLTIEKRERKNTQALTPKMSAFEDVFTLERDIAADEWPTILKDHDDVNNCRVTVIETLWEREWCFRNNLSHLRAVQARVVVAKDPSTGWGPCEKAIALELIENVRFLVAADATFNARAWLAQVPPPMVERGWSDWENWTPTSKVFDTISSYPIANKNKVNDNKISLSPTILEVHVARLILISERCVLLTSWNAVIMDSTRSRPPSQPPHNENDNGANHARNNDCPYTKGNV